MNLTPKVVEALREAYEKAVARGDDQFTFESLVFDTKYAGYLLEYLLN